MQRVSVQLELRTYTTRGDGGARSGGGAKLTRSMFGKIRFRRGVSCHGKHIVKASSKHLKTELWYLILAGKA